MKSEMTPNFNIFFFNDTLIICGANFFYKKLANFPLHSDIPSYQHFHFHSPYQSSNLNSNPIILNHILLQLMHISLCLNKFNHMFKHLYSMNIEKKFKIYINQFKNIKIYPTQYFINSIKYIINS